MADAWLAIVTKYVVFVIDAMVLIILAIGSVEAFFSGLRAMLVASRTDQDRREVWLRFARWLVFGLTFQLAADVIKTSVTQGWDDLGRLAAIAAIRTFLNFFLERDFAESQRAVVRQP